MKLTVYCRALSSRRLRSNEWLRSLRAADAARPNSELHAYQGAAYQGYVKPFTTSLVQFAAHPGKSPLESGKLCIIRIGASTDVVPHQMAVP